MAASIDSLLSYELALNSTSFLIKLNMNLMIESYEKLLILIANTIIMIRFNNRVCLLFLSLPKNLIYEGNANIGKSIFHFINPMDLNHFMNNLRECILNCDLNTLTCTKFIWFDFIVSAKEFVEFKYRITDDRVIDCKAVMIQKYLFQLNPPDAVEFEDNVIFSKDFYEILLINDFAE